jgi:hypothetical protein
MSDTPKEPRTRNYKRPRKLKNGWSPDAEKKCKHVAQRRGAFVWLHNKTARQHEHTNNQFDMAVKILLYVIGAGGIISVFFNSTNVKWISFIFGLLTSMVGIVKTVHSSMKLTGKIRSQSHASAQNNDLFTEIRQELVKPRPVRVPYYKFYSRILEKESKIDQIVPTIPDLVLIKYYNKFGSSALPHDKLLGDFDIYIEKEDYLITDTPKLGGDRDVLPKSPKTEMLKSLANRKPKKTKKLTTPTVKINIGKKSNTKLAKLKGVDISTKDRYKLDIYAL